MLVSLRIRNLALIEDLTWEPGPGFNTLTGETGAGKSILIDALNLLLGERADKTLIRTGADTCSVEAEITLTDNARLKEINLALEEIGAEPCEGRALLLKRSLSAAGANRQFINGSPVPLVGLKSVGDLLVDVHGPHDHQSLLATEKQAGLLDAYGKLDPFRAACAKAFGALREIEQERAALKLSESEREQRLSLLQHQVGEIRAAHLQAGEDERVENDYRAASHAQNILEQAGIISGLLNDSENAVMTQLAQVERALTAWQRMDDSIADAEELNRQAIAQLQELLATVQTRAERVDLDPAQLRQLEDRLNLVQSLKRKYGGTMEAVIAFGEKAASQLAALESSAEFLATLAERKRPLVAHWKRPRRNYRRRDARSPGRSVKRFRRNCGRLVSARLRLFQIEITPATKPGPSGGDHIEFIFAPNPGEAARPLRAIASSGEMARVMLAVKTTLAEVDEIPILIFDEVDAKRRRGENRGPGRQKMRGLGRSHQVLCITHLPQVAAQGQKSLCQWWKNG